MITKVFRVTSQPLRVDPVVTKRLQQPPDSTATWPVSLELLSWNWSVLQILINRHTSFGILSLQTSGCPEKHIQLSLILTHSWKEPSELSESCHMEARGEEAEVLPTAAKEEGGWCMCGWKYHKSILNYKYSPKLLRAQWELGAQSAVHHTRLCPCKGMGHYMAIPAATETKHALKATTSFQSVTEQLSYLGQGTLSPEALSDTSAAEALARGAQPGRKLLGAISYAAIFGFYSSPTHSAQVHSPTAQLVLRNTPGAGSWVWDAD